MSKRDSSQMQVTPQLLLRAYAAGMFPMAESAESDDIHWYEPDIRGIIPLHQFHLPRSLRKVIKSERFDLRVDTAFEQVLAECAASREGRETTWINPKIKALYSGLHAMGHAHSVECWRNGTLVGGLYGVRLGGAFFGESMFSLERDASKVALCHLVARMRVGRFQLLDTQFTTDHLKKFGAIDITRDRYQELLSDALYDDGEFYPDGFWKPTGNPSDQDGGGTSSEVILHSLSQIS